MILTAEELQHASKLDAQLEAFLKANPPPSPPPEKNYQTTRTMMENFEQAQVAALGPAPEGIEEFDKDIPMSDGFISTIRITTPSTPPAGGSPLFVLYFGGGFVGGSRLQFAARARVLINLFGAVVVAAQYRLAPEHKAPQSTKDGFDTAKWASDNAASLGADPKVGFIVGGSSAGGNMSAIVARRAQAEEPLSNPLTGAWLEIPVVFRRKEQIPEKYQHLWVALEQNSQGLTLGTADIEMLEKTGEWDVNSPWFTPVAYSKSYEGLPPTYFQVAGADPLRDDALIYEEMLKEAGVKTKLDLYPGVPHGFNAFFTALDVAKKANIDTFLGIAWLLGKQVSVEEVVKALPKVPGV